MQPKSFCIFVIFISALWSSNTNAQSTVVRVGGSAEKWQLIRDEQPYLIRGVGGDGSWELLAKLGVSGRAEMAKIKTAR